VPVSEIAYSADGARIATLADGVVEIWDARSGRRLRRVDVHLGRVNGVASHPGDPDLVVTAGVDRSAVVWSARTGRPVVTLPHAEAVTAVSFSANGRRVVTGDSTGSLRVWEWRTGTLLGSMRAHGDEVTAAFSPGGRVVLSAGRDRVPTLSNCRTCVVPLAEVRREAEAHLRELGRARG
jgi:WD40 repeat protein